VRRNHSSTASNTHIAEVNRTRPRDLTINALKVPVSAENTTARNLLERTPADPGRGLCFGCVPVLTYSMLGRRLDWDHFAHLVPC